MNIEYVCRSHADVIRASSPAGVGSEPGRRSGRRVQPASAPCAARDGPRHSRFLALGADACRETASGRRRRVLPRAGRGQGFDTHQVKFLHATVKKERHYLSRFSVV